MPSYTLLFLSLTLLTASPLVAAPSASKSTPPPAPPTLALALLTATPPQQGLVLTVGAEHVPLPPGTDMPAADATLSDIATAFGERIDTFGSVTVIAPATKVALNENPGPPDTSADLNSYTAIKVLMASLDDTQWKSLTSQTGLGLTDLSDDSQKALFHGLFHQGRLWVASQDPEMAKLPAEKRTDIKDVSDQIDGIRLRLGQTAKFHLHDKQGGTIYFSGTPPDAADRLHTWSPIQEPSASAHNVLLRAIIPNTPKDGDLRPNSAVLHIAVSWAGAMTVGELMTRIAGLTHQEIYADPHYARRTVTLLGPQTTAPAGDLLRAIALAVAGTYRQVGPAFVLTDDVAGVGTRRERLREWADIAAFAALNLYDEAGQTMLDRRSASARALPTLGDPFALTPEQMAALKDDESMPGIPSISGTDYPFSKLTSKQQAWGHQMASEYEERLAGNTPPSYLTEEAPHIPDFTGQVTLSAHYNVQLIVPGIASPVDTNFNSALSMLFYPGEAAFYERSKAVAAKKPTPMLPPIPQLAAVLNTRPRRAVVAHPRTSADVDALLLAMQKLELNALYIDIF